MKQILMSLCGFVVAAGTWLAVMENVLKHDGYAGRTVMDVCIVAQAALTLLFLLVHGRAFFRRVVLVCAAAVMLLGISAIIRLSQSQHFEGFVLIIGAALIFEGALTWQQLLKRQPAPSL
jgi:hypothetical protein